MLVVIFRPIKHQKKFAVRTDAHPVATPFSKNNLYPFLPQTKKQLCKLKNSYYTQKETKKLKINLCLLKTDKKHSKFWFVRISLLKSVYRWCFTLAWICGSFFEQHWSAIRRRYINFIWHHRASKKERCFPSAGQKIWHFKFTFLCVLK